MKKLLFIFLLIVSVLSCMKKKGIKVEDTSTTVKVVKEQPAISGELINGLRYLDVVVTNPEISFTVYRGDYIVFKSTNGELKVDFPGLGISKKFPNNDDPIYIKMKKTGSYQVVINTQAGIINVVEFENYSYKALTAQDAKKLIDNISPLILDVRTEREFNTVHIAGALLLPVQELQSKIDTLSKYKDQDILIYCASGNRSTVASKILIEQGFLKIYNLRFGIKDWIRSGYSVE